MLSEVDQAAQAAAGARENWHVMSVRRGGPQVWTIDYGAHDGVVTITIQCRPGATKDEARQKIEEQLHASFSNQTTTPDAEPPRNTTTGRLFGASPARALSS